MPDEEKVLRDEDMRRLVRRAAEQSRASQVPERGLVAAVRRRRRARGALLAGAVCALGATVGGLTLTAMGADGPSAAVGAAGGGTQKELRCGRPVPGLVVTRDADTGLGAKVVAVHRGTAGAPVVEVELSAPRRVVFEQGLRDVSVLVLHRDSGRVVDQIGGHRISPDAPTTGAEVAAVAERRTVAPGRPVRLEIEPDPQTGCPSADWKAIWSRPAEYVLLTAMRPPLSDAPEQPAEPGPDHLIGTRGSLTP
ncbi:hypothetical protein [Streptomyces sp. NPDC003077]|uniref:hypothetical protein n=1 Tax=Streptomyces sp. NPDC003077 TaxID=3154443 RepID=UPI0033BD82F8